MAKGQVTDEELQAGLKSLGGLGGIAASGARRDSPFGSSFVKNTATQATTPAIEAPPKEEPVKIIEVKSREDEQPNVKPPAIAPAKKIVAPRSPEVNVFKSKKTSPEELESHRKSDTLTERVTLQMSPEMRDAVNDLARRIQRKKIDKTERITANTVMRAAIQGVLDAYKFELSDVPNSEEELTAAFRTLLK